jgi:transposase
MEALLMWRHEVTNEQWATIEPHLPGKKSDPGRTEGDNRSFINAVFWVARTGFPWRDLPAQFGPWGAVYKRFSRWGKRGV